MEACERCSMKNKNNRMCLLLCCTEPKEVAVHLRAVRLLQCFVPSVNTNFISNTSESFIQLCGTLVA